ncbi:hypothetical protein SDC9_184830 [bioreactor metagenome]|uniref:Uncharacterized protein n=1 Tax=bioreactor metagenome TaxID=1076179 RepID=A0A645HMH5_9ZZZZ
MFTCHFQGFYSITTIDKMVSVRIENCAGINGDVLVVLGQQDGRTWVVFVWPGREQPVGVGLVAIITHELLLLHRHPVGIQFFFVSTYR